MPETISFTKAILNYFGKKPGQSMGELAAEIKTLTEKDKADLIPELKRELGVTIAG